MRQVEVRCLVGAESYAVPLGMIRESLRKLEAGRPGTSDRDGPARDYAGLLDPDTVARGLEDEEREAFAASDLARWENDGGALEGA